MCVTERKRLQEIWCVLVACPAGCSIPQVAVALQSLSGKLTGQQSRTESQLVAQWQKVSTPVQLF